MLAFAWLVRARETSCTFVHPNSALLETHGELLAPKREKWSFPEIALRNLPMQAYRKIQPPMHGTGHWWLHEAAHRLRPIEEGRHAVPNGLECLTLKHRVHLIPRGQAAQQACSVLSRRPSPAPYVSGQAMTANSEQQQLPHYSKVHRQREDYICGFLPETTANMHTASTPAMGPGEGLHANAVKLPLC